MAELAQNHDFELLERAQSQRSCHQAHHPTAQSAALPDRPQHRAQRRRRGRRAARSLFSRLRQSRVLSRRNAASTWLARIVVNEALGCLRRRRPVVGRRDGRDEVDDHPQVGSCAPPWPVSGARDQSGEARAAGAARRQDQSRRSRATADEKARP